MLQVDHLQPVKPMEGRPERIADYFVVVGVGNESVSKFEPFSSEEGVALPADQQNAAVQEPVTDIAVYYSKHEQLPKGYKYVCMQLRRRECRSKAGMSQ